MNYFFGLPTQYSIMFMNLRSMFENTPIACKGGKFTGEFRCCKLNNNNTDLPLKPHVRGSPETELDPIPVITTEEDENNCGQQKTIFHSRIFVDEEDVAPIEGEFPWMVVIFETTASGKYEFLCSGSLIHPKVVLTVAHKIYRWVRPGFVVISRMFHSFWFIAKVVVW